MKDFLQTDLYEPLLNTFGKGRERQPARSMSAFSTTETNTPPGNARTSQGQGCQEKGKTALRHQHMALPEFALAKFLLGLNVLFL